MILNKFQVSCNKQVETFFKITYYLTIEFWYLVFFFKLNQNGMFSYFFNKSVYMNIFLFMFVPPCLNQSRAPIARSVATKAVNPGVASSNPGSANIISAIWQKSMQLASFVFHQWALVYVEKQPVPWKECCVLYWCEKSRKHISKWTGCRDMTEKLLRKALNINHLLKPKQLYHQYFQYFDFYFGGDLNSTNYLGFYLKI